METSRTAGRYERRGVVGVAILVVVAHLLLAVLPLSATTIGLISTGIWAASGLAAVVLCVLARRGLSGRERRIWTYMSLATAGFAIGAAWRLHSVLTAGVVPEVGSLEDVGLVLGFAFLLPVVASLGNPVHASKLRRLTSVLDMLSVCTLALIVVYTAGLVPGTSGAQAHWALREAMFSVYVVLAVAFAAYPVIYRRDPWTPRAMMIVSAVGCAAAGLVAMLATIGAGTYLLGSSTAVLIDTLFIASYAFVCMAAVWRMTPWLDPAPSPRAADDVMTGWPAITFAAASVVVIPVALTVAVRAGDERYAAVLVAAVSVLVALLLARGAATLFENRRLGGVRETAARYRTLVENSPGAVIVLDRAGKLIYANEAAARLLEAPSPFDLIDRSARDLVAPDGADSAAFRDVEAVVRMTGAGSGGGTGGIPAAVVTMHTVTGRRVEVERTVALIEYDGAPAVLVQGVDVTARVDAERASDAYAERLQYAAAEALSAVEEERRRLGRALDEQVGQPLEVARARLRATQEQGLLMGEGMAALEAVGRAIAQYHALSADLSLDVLRDHGILEGLEGMCEEFSASSGIACEISGEVRNDAIAGDARAALYRSAREALGNAVKHAHVSSVRIACAERDGWAEVTITDAGVGFDPAEVVADAGEGLGLLRMQERVERVQGRLSVESTPGHGTRVTIAVPVLGLPITD